jgi:hypothetical protein
VAVAAAAAEEEAPSTTRKGRGKRGGAKGGGGGGGGGGGEPAGIASASSLPMSAVLAAVLLATVGVGAALAWLRAKRGKGGKVSLTWSTPTPT